MLVKLLSTVILEDREKREQMRV